MVKVLQTLVSTWQDTKELPASTRRCGQSEEIINLHFDCLDLEY